MDDSLIWFIVCVALIALEMFMPGVIVIFFAFGALIISILELFVDLPFVWEASVFAISSTLSLGVLRNKFKEALQSKKNNLLRHDDYVGKKVIVVEDLIDSNIGKVELHGTNWKAISEDELKVGDEAIVIERDNITLKVAKIDFN
jgi:membrane protein implicated in regulation of membrane protease activity